MKGTQAARWWIGVAFVLGACLWVAACATTRYESILPAVMTEKVPGATAVGTEACADCHEDEPHFYFASYHKKAFFDGTKAAGCESCHGKGSVHAEYFYENDEYEDEPDDLVNGEDIGEMSPSERSALCMSCHQQDFPLWPTSEHARYEVGCWDCHANDLHAPPDDVVATGAEMDQQSDSEFCLQCHESVRTSFHLQYRHRVLEGQMKCADCHPVHGEAHNNPVVHGPNATCLECHTEVAGPYVFEHLGVEEGCDSCHAPHGSINNKLLVSNDNSLCIQCHFQEPTGFFGRQPHSNFLVGGALCYDCHAHVHGSNTDRNLNPRRF